MNKQKKNPGKRVGRAKQGNNKVVRLLRSTNIWQRIGLGIILLVLIFTFLSWALYFWYAQRHNDEPWVVGTTFVPRYAKYFGLDPKDTMRAMIDEVGFRDFRLVSYWDDIEETQGIYNFRELDWQFKMIEDAGGKISLAIGLRQPRWPECHMPKWAENMPMTEWEPRLMQFMEAAMERYKNSPALVSYQLENEFFLDVFGICPDFSRERLIREYDFAKKIDSSRPIIVSRSNNALGYPIGQPRPDEYAVSVYKRVWDKTITKRYFEYPFPAWFYGSLAGGGELITGKKLMIHELQMEAWLPDTGEFAMNSLASVPEQNKSMNADRLRDRFEYGRATGIREMYTWGAEWWYWRKVKANDPSLWNVAREEVSKMQAENKSKGLY